MRRGNTLRLQSLLACCSEHPVGDELLQNGVIRMLQLASAATGKMATWRVLVVGAVLNCPVGQNAITRHRTFDVLPAFPDPIALRSEADDGFSVGHRQAA